MDKIIERGLLFDFYGELLTPHQQKIYSEIVFNDLSLGEMSEQEGISRQGIHDLIKRCDKLLMDYESKLGLIRRFQNIKQEVENCDSIISSEDSLSASVKSSIKKSLDKIIEEL